ncbi:MAG: hypothetical protein NW220_08410 [Leptolyngbyaceae cyanobacterium bins.349]|nr:hypothetical protein [Leptolyngbyaceae cyanobacterium bins.349]
MFSTYYFTRFPLWQFLNQPVFTKKQPTTFNPQQFWRRYQLEMLERCLRIDCASGDVRRD